MNQINGLMSSPWTTVDPLILVRNLLLSLIFAYALYKVFYKCSRVITDKRQYAGLFFIIIPTMILIISVIQSSLSLSLGLVGALSIVRFRTPVKEVEELVYIFLAISVGLGLGANQVIVTSVSFVMILGVILFVDYFYKQKRPKSVFIDMELSKNINNPLVAITKLLSQKNIPIDVRRYLERDSQLFITISGNFLSVQQLDDVLSSLRGELQPTSIGVVGQDRQLS